MYEDSEFSTPSQHLLSIFMIIAILESMKWYLLMALVCIFLIVTNVEQFSMLGICMPPLEKCLFRSFAYYLTGLFVFISKL